MIKQEKLDHWETKRAHKQEEKVSIFKGYVRVSYVDA